MHVFARLPPTFLRRLRAVLRLAIPTAVAADTARSIVVTYNLAQERFKEWEDEDREATRAEVAALLRGVARRCAAADRDFWPAFENAVASAESGSAAASIGTGSSSGGSDAAALSQAGAAAVGGSSSGAADVWQLMGLGNALGTGIGAASSSSDGSGGISEHMGEQQQQQQGQQASLSFAAPTHEHAAWAEQEAAQLLRFEKQQQQAAGAGHGVSAAAAQAGATLVVVTLSEACSHLASEVGELSLPWTTLLAPSPGVVHVTLSDVLSILGNTRPALAAASKQQRLGQRILQAADTTAASARAALPWPQVALSRKSALRFAVEWRGVHWPEKPREPLERELSQLC